MIFKRKRRNVCVSFALSVSQRAKKRRARGAIRVMLLSHGWEFIFALSALYLSLSPYRPLPSEPFLIFLATNLLRLVSCTAKALPGETELQ
jgi:hypothetical protein